MKLFITAKPMAKEDRVEKIDAAHFTVSVREPPVEGRANRAIIKAMADFLGIAPSRLKIVSGYSSRSKVLEVL